jgi:membrane protease YdiL (CAAX protease family)
MSSDLSSSPNRTDKRIRNAIKAVVLIFGTIGLFFAGQILGIYGAVALLSLFGVTTSEINSLLRDSVLVRFLTVLLISIITIGLLWWMHLMKKQRFLHLVGMDKKPKLSSLGYALMTYGMYLLAFIVTVGIATQLLPGLNIDQAQQLGFDNVAGRQLIIAFFTLVVLPPIAEEIIFRGFLYQRLNGLINIYPAAIITSIIFALAHTEFLGDNPLNWIAALDTFVLSFFLIYLVHKTKSLWASIFLHAIKNCIAFAVLFIL